MSTDKTPLILVTNDDGYDAPGLAALLEAVEPFGRLVVAAPEREQSGSSHALTLDRPLRVRRVQEDRYRIDGTPTDCVHLAIHGLTGGQHPDLVLSGINRGLNVGDDVTYSGTVAGALEGALLRIPALAFSAEIDDRGEPAFATAAAVACQLVPEVLRRGLPRGALLNVNVPRAAPRGLRVTRQGTRNYRATALERVDPSGRPYFWIDSIDMTPTGERDGDHRAISEGYVSITPLHTNLTHEPLLEPLTDWDIGLD
jgi:5'-nucleotidase